jgi:hypothetical protein
MNPKVYCTNHAAELKRTNTEIDDDGTQVLVKQYWEAVCGCKVEITLAMPKMAQA